MSFKSDRITGIPAPLPLDYDRQYSFTNWEANNPGTPPPASGLEAEFNAIQQALDETQDRLQLIQDDDGSLQNESVGNDQLKSEVLVGANAPTPWEPVTSYAVSDTVFQSNIWYYCLEAHVSDPSSFATDLGAGKWRELLDLTSVITTEAQNWANYPEDSLVPEGDLVDDYSALHHAAKAAASAAAAAAAAATIPDPATGAIGDRVQVDAAGTAYELFTPTPEDTAATADTLAKRDATGCVKVADPVVAQDAANKNYVDTAIDDAARPQWTLAEPFGPAFSIAGANAPRVAALNSTDVALIDTGLGELRTYRIDRSDGTWALVGSGLAIAGMSTLAAVCAISDTDVAMIDGGNDELRRYTFDGSNWSLVGSGLSIPGVSSAALAHLTGTDIAFVDDNIRELRTYRHDGANWSLVGSGLSFVNAATPSLAGLTPTDVAMLDSTSDELRRYTFDGSNWSLVGSGLSLGTVGVSSLAALTDRDVAALYSPDDELRVYTFDPDAATWAQSGGGLPVSTINGGLAALDRSTVAFAEGFSTDELRAYSMGFTTDRSLPNPYDLPLYGVRAWCNADCSGATTAGAWATLRGAGNIASVTRTANLGEFDVVFAVPMPDANYSVTTGVSSAAGAQETVKVYGFTPTGFTFRGLSAEGTNADLPVVTFQVVR